MGSLVYKKITFMAWFSGAGKKNQ